MSWAKTQRDHASFPLHLYQWAVRLDISVRDTRSQTTEAESKVKVQFTWFSEGIHPSRRKKRVW